MLESEVPEKLQFRPFTRESTAAIEGRIVAEELAKKQLHYKQHELQENLQAEYEQQQKKYGVRKNKNPILEAGQLLPRYMQSNFPNHLYSTPIEDIDMFYQNKKTFVVINKRKDIVRFSATKAMWIMDPFCFLRRAAIYIMVQPIFSMAILITVLINCILLTVESDIPEDVEPFFITIYTLELIIKVTARGFAFNKFTYLRDPWNWLDFVIVLSAYTTMFVGDVFGFIEFLRALKIIAHVRGLKTCVNAVAESARNLINMFILTFLFLSVFAIIGLKFYKGSLRQICIATLPEEYLWNMTREEVDSFRNDSSNWYLGNGGEPLVCGNTSWAQSCPAEYTCYKKYGANPNYGYTSFDNFGWAFLSAFRLMTQDFWEDLLYMILHAMGPRHVIFFIAIIFICSFYLLNLILAILAVSYGAWLYRTKFVQEEEEELLMLIEEEQRRNGTTSASNGEVLEGETITDGETNKKMDPNCTQENPCFCLKCIDCFCVWNCCDCWVKFQKNLCLVAYDPFFELFIFLCIVVNTIFMAMDNSDISRETIRMLTYGNYFFMAIYTSEAILKILAISPKNYFKDGWNIFDFIIVVFGLIDLILLDVKGLSISFFRALRILRIFKLAKSWPTFEMLIIIIGRALCSLGYLTLTMGIIIFVFSHSGCLLFGQNYDERRDRFYDGEIPRWNFVDIFHSFMIIFRSLCGEWIETMWDCLRVNGMGCLPFFVAFVLIGKLLVFNIFIALLLNVFANINIYSDNDTATTVAVAVDRVKRFSTWVKRSVCKCAMKPISTKVTDQATPNDEENLIDNRLEMREKKGHLAWTTTGIDPLEMKTNGEEINKKDEAAEEESKGEEESKVPFCCLDCCYRKIPCCAGKNTSFWSSWYNLRLKMSLLVKNKFFTIFVFIVILISCIVLTQENKENKKNKTVNVVLICVDHVITVFFLTEMVIKWLAMGCRKYFTNAWCWLDFIINVMLIIYLGDCMFGTGYNLVFKSMRALRSLRILRIVYLIPGLRLTAGTLLAALPDMLQVLIVNLIIWLMFSIMGVQFFGGKFYKCQTAEGAPFNLSGAWQEHMGEEDWNPEHHVGKNECDTLNVTWKNTAINFDNVANGFLALFQVATFKGWISIMADASDIKDRHVQPEYEANVYAYLFFVAFIIIGSFFTLNLLTGVIVINFNRQKMISGGSLEMFMTEDQKKYYKALVKIGSIKPQAIPMPSFLPLAVIYHIVKHKIFNGVVLLVILANVIVLAMDHYDITETFALVLKAFDITFIVIFSIEVFLKIIAFRQYYFKDRWNLFDIVVLFLCIIGDVLRDLLADLYVPPSLLRVFKIGHLLRLTKLLKGVRTLITTLITSLPAVFNICLLLFLIIFIYSIFGMSFFMNVKNDGFGLDYLFNFESFGHSIIVLFQLITAAGWDSVLHGLSNEKNCTLPNPEEEGDCGNRGLAIAFLVSYEIITFLIIIQIYIAVILYSYNRALEDEEELTDDDYDMYYATWEKFDSMCTSYIKYPYLSYFLDELEEPLKISRPNKYKIVSMDIPICNGDQLYCIDILDSITKDYFARRGCPVEESADLGEITNHRPGVVSSTLWRQREELCAAVIQKSWRQYRSKAQGDESSSMLVTDEPKPPPTPVEVFNDVQEAEDAHSHSPSIKSQPADVEEIASEN